MSCCVDLHDTGYLAMTKYVAFCASIHFVTCFHEQVNTLKRVMQASKYLMQGLEASNESCVVDPMRDRSQAFFCEGGEGSYLYRSQTTTIL